MEQQEALEQIKLIRETMQKATHQFLFSPWQWIEWGVVVIIGGLTTLWMQATNNTEYILMVWLAVLIVGSTLEGVAWLLAVQHRGYDPLSPIYLKIWGIFFCLLLPATVFSIVLAQLHLPLYIVGLWIVTVAAAMFILVLFGERKELMYFGALMLIGGILSVSIFIDQAIWLGVICFGGGSLATGIYLLIQDNKTFHSEEKK